MKFTGPLLDLLPLGRHWRMSQYRRQLPAILAYESQFMSASAAELLDRSLALRYRAQCREPLRNLVVETYALVREAARRTIGLCHYPEQLLGGLALFDGGIAEMQTGEGKTLVATLPLVLRALAGQGTYLATANDYLATRDAHWMAPVYGLLGLQVGVVTAASTRAERRAAYARDLTYGTAREFGFDFLRDRLARRESESAGNAWMFGDRGAATPAMSTGTLSAGSAPAGEVQRKLHSLLVDEADSLLIDEARTPLILAGSPPDNPAELAAGCHWGASVAAHFGPPDYEFDERRQHLELTTAGREKLRGFPVPRALDGLKLYALHEIVERAILVSLKFHRDQHYVVRDGEIVIVDEFTGRASEGRRWQAGIHQAIEAREGVPITQETQTLARITVQDFFLRFPLLSGMTGTASPSRQELRQVYSLPVVPIPTHHPSRRQFLPVRVFATVRDKWEAVVLRARELQSSGRPLLIGTRVISASEQLSEQLKAAGIEHAVLNARDPEREAAIVAAAGQQGKVTVATNMAGRGTDIELGPGVHELGGLHVLGTEMHDSARIDRQLVGRCARQGDPGSFEQFLSLEDELLRSALGAERARQIADQEGGALRRDPVAGSRRLMALFRSAQRKMEHRHRYDRVLLQRFEKERQRMHRELGQDPYLDAVD